MSIILLLQQAHDPSCCRLVLAAVIFVEARRDDTASGACLMHVMQSAQSLWNITQHC